jgi:hypothetical protein
LELLQDGIAPQGVTRVVAHVGDVCVDTDVPADDAYIALDGSEVTLTLGLHPDLALVNGVQALRLTVYSALHPQGLAWSRFGVNVIPWAGCA